MYILNVKYGNVEIEELHESLDDVLLSCLKYDNDIHDDLEMKIEQTKMYVIKNTKNNKK